MHQKHSKAADVYSFGIVLWELMTWQVPWDDYNQFQVQCSLRAGTKAHLPDLEYAFRVVMTDLRCPSMNNAVHLALCARQVLCGK